VLSLFCAGYSLIYNPWLCLIFEAMESLTSSLATTAAVTYAAALSTSSTDTSIQGLIGGLYYGVGKFSNETTRTKMGKRKVFDNVTVRQCRL